VSRRALFLLAGVSFGYYQQAISGIQKVFKIAWINCAMKILLVEDEQQLADSIQTYLTDKDFACEWVSTSKAAIDKITAYEYDCILLDLMLPDGNGFDILKN
jgi:PleD family two-component response regulator